MNQTYPAYSSMPQASLPQVDFSTSGMSSYNSSQPIAITPVGASSPKRATNGYIDLGGGGSDWNTGGVIGDANGNHGGETTPIGDICWPLLLFLSIYLLQHICKKKALQ